MRRGLTIAVTIAALATWWPAMAGAATGWVLQPTPAPPASALYGVSCPSATSCTAVGAYQLADLQPGSLAEQYSGGRWQVQATTRPAAARILEAVSCTAAGCTAAGYHYSSTTGQAGTLAERD